MQADSGAVTLVTRLRRLVGGLVLAASIGVGWLGYSTAESVARDEARQWLADAVALYESLLTEFLTDYHDAAKTVAAHEPLLQAVAAHVDAATLQARFHQYLLDQVNDTAGVAGILVTDRSGRVIAASDARNLGRSFATDPDFQRALVAEHVSEPHFTGGKYHAFAALPLVGKDREPLGAVMALFDWTALVRVITSPQRLGASGEVVLGVQRGDQVQVLVPSPGGEQSIKLPVTQTVPGRAVAHSFMLMEMTDARGDDVLAAFRPAGNTNWGLVVKLKSSQVFQNVRRLRWSLAGSTLMLLLFAMAAAHVLARRITGPVLELSMQAARIASGDLAARVLVQTPDEIGALARHFNRMAENLTISHATLEDQVNVRTAELQKAIGKQKEAVEELNRSHEQLRLAAKMEAVGTLAAGVAHHFSNLIQVMLGHAEALEQAIPVGHAHRPALETISRTGDRASALVRQMLRYARRDASHPQVVDAAAVAQDTATMLQSLVPSSIAFRVDAVPGPARIFIDPRDLEEALVNLVINARDAMPAGGALAIVVGAEDAETALTQSVDVAAQRAEQGAAADAPGEQVTITVEDSGVGMDDAARTRMFEPFYTTKAPDRGTGLGLALVYRIVQRAGGTIDVRSTPGEGTRITLRFPRRVPAETVTATLLPDETASVEAQVPSGDETLLVVEDHAELRDVLVQRLTERGYTVLEAESGGAAVAIVRDWTDPLQLVIVDTTLPDFESADLAGSLAALRPDLKIIYMVEQRGDPQPDGQPALPGIARPFRIATLMRLIRSTLDET